MLLRRAPLIAVGLIVLASGCASDVAPAARVGDETITTEELFDEVGEWAGNAQTQRSVDLAATESPSGYAMGPVISILHERIIFTITGPAFDEMGLELTDTLRQQALTVILGDPSQADAAFGAFTDAYAQRYVDDLAKGIAVQEQLGDEGFVDLVREGASDLELNPRFGTWDEANITIVPPEGPQAPSGNDLLVP